MFLRYGIMSTSSIAPRFIAAVREAKAGEIVAISSRTLEKAKEKAVLWDIPHFYGSHSELVKDENVNIVYISCVNSKHYSLAKQALNAGKHVVCEKPCTTSVQQTRELFSLAREKGLFFMEAQKMLFLPAILEVKKRIEEGYLGNIHMAVFNQSFSAEYNTWQFDKALGGGTLLSGGIYAIEFLLWLFGSFKTIGGACSAFENGSEWQFVLNGEMMDDIVFSINNSTKVVLDNTARIYGTEGYVEIPEYWKARKLIFHKNGKEPEIMEFACKYELIYEAEHILYCMENHILNSPVVTEELTLGGIAAIEKILGQWNVR